MGAKSGQSGKSVGRQRLWLALFGGLVVLLFLAFAVTQGLGQPSVPADDVAVVEEVPDELGQISREQFDRTLAQQVAQSELNKAPKEGSERYEELKQQALGELLDIVWLQGEAEELGITVTDKQIENELEQIKEQNFPTAAAYKEFLETSKYTQEDVDIRVKLQILNNQIQEIVTQGAPRVSNEQIADYYEAAKEEQFTTEPSRDVRIITNKNEAKVEQARKALESDSSPAAWNRAAKKYSEDPTTKESGGLQEGLTEEILPEPLKADIFQAATGELIGPVEFQGNFSLVEVVKLNPEKAQSLGEVRAQIRNQLVEQAGQEQLTEFITNYQSKWASRTFCADGFRDNERCANAELDPHPANAPPGCYEANPKEGEALECPAPVPQLAPAVPGSVTVLQPQGERLPQRPLPEATEGGEGGETPSLEELESQIEEGGAPGGASGE